MADLLAPGVTWPGYRNEEKNRDVIVQCSRVLHGETCDGHHSEWDWMVDN